MPYFRNLSAQLEAIGALLDRNESWAIVISADPDALASAMALRRIIRHRVKSVSILRINEISRPDNLAMMRYLRIPSSRWRPTARRRFQRFAIVDSQPHHNPQFSQVQFSIAIDHHPLPEIPADVPFADIRPEYGSVSSMMTEYLYSAGIRPGKLLATALQYGIRTDTGMFGPQCSEIDIRAYHYLSRYGDSSILSRITRSEYLPDWLAYFSRAFETLRHCGKGRFAWLGTVESADILVVIADFFLKVSGLLWIAVCGISGRRVTVVLRGGFGSMDLGGLASRIFLPPGGGGGHKSVARAEIGVADVCAESMDGIEEYVFRRLLEESSVIIPQKSNVGKEES